METDLRVRGGGGGDPLLLLLHGLGATGAVWSGWRPMLVHRWPGRWLAPDLPGHGGSGALPDYTFDALARAVSPLVGSDGRTVVLGHSLGGVVALALAARSPAPVTLARGEHDTMNTDEQLRALGAPVVTLPGLGHNAHLESPEQCMALLEPQG